jgi:hypothetical protein
LEIARVRFAAIAEDDAVEFNSEAEEEEYKELLDTDANHIDMEIWSISQNFQ